MFLKNKQLSNQPEKGKNKRITKNWRLISLLDIHTKLVPKVLTKRLKTALASLISSNQMTYLNERFISEVGRLTLLTVDTEKAFDSVKHNFLLKVLENHGFSKDLLKLISILF